jgi:hypothetical protein
VTSAQTFTIAGYVNTSHGRVSTKIEENVNFSNAQNVTSTATTFGQSLVQTSTVDSKITTKEGHITTGKEKHVSYPFNISYLETVESNGNIGQVTTVSQDLVRDETETLEGFPIFRSHVGNQVTSGDTATFVASPTGYSLGPNSGQTSKQTYVHKDTAGNCYGRTLTAANNVLTAVADQKECHSPFAF